MVIGVQSSSVLTISYAILGCVLTHLLIKLLLKWRKFRHKCSLVNQFPPVLRTTRFLWGHIKDIPLVMDEDGLKFRREWVKKHSDGWLVWWSSFLPEISLTSCRSVKEILKTTEPKGFAYELMRPWLGDGLLISKGQKWARNRRLLTPAFHFDALKSYLSVKNEAADVLCSKFDKYADNGEFFDICFMVSMFTLDVMLQCAFSYQTHCQHLGNNHQYVHAIDEMGRITVDRFTRPWLHINWIFFLTKEGKEFQKHSDYAHKIAEEIIAERKKEFQNGDRTTIKSQDFLDILLMSRDEDNKGLSDLEIRNEVDTFLFEGHDTTASAIYWTLYSLAKHGTIQDKVQHEIDSVFMGRDSDHVWASDMQRLPFLTMCIKESLRLHCPVSFIQRQTENDIDVCGKTIPGTTQIGIIIYCVHHNPEIWENSMDFIPERFLPENVEKRDPFAFIPFSAGPRNCIGQNFAMHEIKIAVVKILSRFFLEVDEHHDVAHLERLVMRASNGIRIRIKKRKRMEYRFE